MYADKLSNVRNFVVLMNWWLKPEVKRPGERVNIPKKDVVSLPQAATLQAEKSKTLVVALIKKVLWRVYSDVKIIPEQRHHQSSTWKQKSDNAHHVMCILPYRIQPLTTVLSPFSNFI